MKDYFEAQFQVQAMIPQFLPTIRSLLFLPQQLCTIYMYNLQITFNHFSSLKISKALTVMMNLALPFAVFSV